MLKTSTKLVSVDPSEIERDGAGHYDCYDCCGMSRKLNIDHDTLLSIETDPEVLIDLLTRAVTWEECDWCDQGYMGPFELASFAARHNWKNPARVMEAMTLLGDVWRGCRNAAKGADVVLAMRQAVAEYDTETR